MADGFHIEIEGKKHYIEDLPFDDLEWLEDTLDVCLADVEDDPLEARKLRTIKGAKALVYLVKKQDEPDITYEDVGKLNFHVFDPPANGNGARPTKARSKKSGGSAPAESGASSSTQD